MMSKKTSSKLQFFLLATIGVSVLASLVSGILLQFFANNAEMLRFPLGSFFQLHHLLSLGLVLVIIATTSYIVIKRLAPLQDLISFAEQLNNLQRPDQDLLTTSRNDDLSLLASSLHGLSDKIHNRFSFAEGVLKNLPNGICVADAENRLTFTNPPVLQFLELDGSPEDYFGINVAKFFYNDSTRDTVTGKVYRQNQN